jgi:putative ABC transport system substrate-binding protein
MANVVKDIEDAARTLGMQLQLVPADGPDDIASAFSMMAKEHVDAFIVMPSPMLFGEHRRIVELAAINRLPGMYQAREFVEVGVAVTQHALSSLQNIRLSSDAVNSLTRSQN